VRSRPGKAAENAFIESFNGKFRAERLIAHWFLDLDDACAKVLRPGLTPDGVSRPSGAEESIVVLAKEKYGIRGSLKGSEAIASLPAAQQQPRDSFTRPSQ
jgi:Integrase core domain